MSLSTSASSGAFVLAVALTGCVSTADKLGSKFASDQACPKDQVRVTEQGANVYRVTGCNERAEYVCSTFANAGSGLPCEERGSVKNAPSGAPTRTRG
jgi:outer membrane lipoprotein SlyB